jgi:NAD(P)H-hydrate epimerase
LLQRKLNSHKGDFGHVFILAGSLRFCGAAILTSLAALRSGAGLVTLGIPRSLYNIFARRIVELMLKTLSETKDKTLSLSAYSEIINFLEKKADILVLGPGLSQNKSTQTLIRRLIATSSKPMVIDADGLNALAGHLNILQNRKKRQLVTILTPHLAEMSRLVGMNIKELKKERKNVAKMLANEYNITVVLKGHNTLVVEGKNIYINKTGNPGMATAGCGDVLTGMIGAFLAQGLSAFSAAKYAVYLHGKAGDLAAKEKSQLSVIASDIIDKLPEAIKASS